jgi:hypothetical protein
LHAVGETQAGGVLEVRVVSTRCIEDTHVWVVTVQDATGTKMDHYLHPQLFELVEGPYPLLIPGRCLRMVGARASTMGSPPRPVLLPTQHLAVMLGTVPGVFDDHLTDPFETIPLEQLHEFRGTSRTCVIAAKVYNVHGNSVYLLEVVNTTNFTVTLELPPAHRQIAQLVRKGEVLRISPSVPTTFDQQNSNSIGYIPGSLICIQALITRMESLLLPDVTGVVDMKYTKARMHMNDIGALMVVLTWLDELCSWGKTDQPVDMQDIL